MLTHAEQQKALTIAQNAIAGALTKGWGPVPGADELTGALAETGCSFVTLTRSGALRGCIGALEPTEALGRDIARHAVAAAFEDPRFAPLDSLAGIRIEISVLGPVRAFPAAGYEDLCGRLPRTGVLIAGLGCRATFLPAVWRQLPATEDFLAALWRKAGLPSRAWPVSVWLYDVEEFGGDASASGSG